MRFGLFARFPLRFGGGRPEAQRIYESMRDNRGERFSKADDGDENRVLRCMARAIAVASSYQRRGANQAHASLATDELPKWEVLLGLPRDPRDTDADRRALCEGVLAGNGSPTYDQIVSALESAIGETVSIVAARAPAPVTGSSTPITSIGLTEVAGAGSRLLTGDHAVHVYFVDADGQSTFGDEEVATIATGSAIRVGALPVAALGYDHADIYLSTSEGAAADGAYLCAYVASTRGDAVTLYDYPRNVGAPGLHHLAIVVSEPAWADVSKRARAHAVLGPMLPAWTTYDLVTESPFLLGSSPLDKGAF